jgi:hypothetical protein
MSVFVARPIGIADAVPAESAAPPRAANPTSAYLNFTLFSVVVYVPAGKYKFLDEPRLSAALNRGNHLRLKRVSRYRELG